MNNPTTRRQESTTIKKLGLVIHKRQPTCRFSVAISLPMGWDGEIGHGTSLQDITFSTIKKQLEP